MGLIPCGWVAGWLGGIRCGSCVEGPFGGWRKVKMIIMEHTKGRAG